MKLRRVPSFLITVLTLLLINLTPIFAQSSPESDLPEGAIARLNAHLGKEADPFYDRIYSIAYSPDGKTLASGHSDTLVAGKVEGTVCLWDTDNYTLKKVMPGNHLPVIWSVTYSPDGKTLASGNWNETVYLWDVGSGALKHTITGTDAADGSIYYSVVYSPDGKTLAAGSTDYTVSLWDADSFILKDTLTGHTGYVHSVVYSPDGKTLASGAGYPEDNTVRLWDADSGASKHTFTIHTSSVLEVAYIAPMVRRSQAGA